MLLVLFPCCSLDPGPEDPGANNGPPPGSDCDYVTLAGTAAVTLIENVTDPYELENHSCPNSPRRVHFTWLPNNPADANLESYEAAVETMGWLLGGTRRFHLVIGGTEFNPPLAWLNGASVSRQSQTRA